MYGLIGFPLGHSFSADFFNRKFRTEGIDEEYILFPLEKISGLPGLIRSHPNLEGLNVTIPHKQDVIAYLTEISDEAAKIGAVNVIKIEDGGKTLKGFNSDVIGFKNSISPLLKPYMMKALVLGTGGASKAVDFVLRELGIEPTFVSRTPRVDAITYDQITKEVMDANTVIVNTTPLGTWPNTDSAPRLPYEYATPRHLFFDLVYNPETTKFMKLASKYGATVKNGLEMLHGQAIAAWDIWCGK